MAGRAGDSVLCAVYRSRRTEGLYLLVSAAGGEDDPAERFDAVPVPLLERFGTPVFSFEFELHAERTLVQADARTVLHELRSNGYYLQMPPNVDPS